MKILHGADRYPRFLNSTAHFTGRLPCSRTNFLFDPPLEHEKHGNNPFLFTRHPLDCHSHDVQISARATFTDRRPSQILSPVVNPALAS